MKSRCSEQLVRALVYNPMESIRRRIGSNSQLSIDTALLFFVAEIWIALAHAQSCARLWLQSRCLSATNGAPKRLGLNRIAEERAFTSARKRSSGQLTIRKQQPLSDRRKAFCTFRRRRRRHTALWPQRYKKNPSSTYSVGSFARRRSRRDERVHCVAQWSPLLSPPPKPKPQRRSSKEPPARSLARKDPADSKACAARPTSRLT